MGQRARDEVSGRTDQQECKLADEQRIGRDVCSQASCCLARGGMNKLVRWVAVNG